MPNEPRMTEPTLEELSAYLDHELDAATQARVAEHVAGCDDCRVRLDGLREAAHAIRALPMETPARTFTIPAQRRQSLRWAPVGWLGGAAAALLIVVVGVTQLHGPAGSSTAGSSGTNHYNAAAPAASQGTTSLDSSRSGAASQAFNSGANTVTITDPLDTPRSITLSTDAKSYAASGTMTVQVRLTGLPSGQKGVVGLLLERNGYGVRLPACSLPCDWSHFQASYQLDSLDLSRPLAGSYTLMAIEQLPGNGDSLVVRLPVTITP
jgi:Putative zinc-finger